MLKILCFSILNLKFNFSSDIITNSLQWKGFIVTSRFTYAFYLVQIPVIQHKIATTRITSQYGYHSIVR